MLVGLTVNFSKQLKVPCIGINALELYCTACGAFTGEEKVFCLRCGLRLIPLTPYDLKVEDYIYQPDAEKISTIRQVWPMAYFAKAFVIKQSERLRKKLFGVAKRVSYPSKLDSLARHCGMLLGLERLPEVLILPSGELNAFTFGTDERPAVIMSSAMLETLSEDEVLAVLAHEFAHVKSKHLIYHTMAEWLAGGMEISASFFGLGLLSIPFRLLLLDWLRESEISADRASLLVVNDISVLRSLLAKLMLHSGKDGRSAYHTSEGELLESLSEVLRTHPTYSRRVEALKEFYRSHEFRAARKKMEERIYISKALVPKCRFCGAGKRITDVFCSVCGRSHV